MPKSIDLVFERNPPPWRAEVEPDSDLQTFTVRDANGGMVCRVTLNEAADSTVIQRLMDAIWFYAQEDGIDTPLEPKPLHP